jgi:hypothetical protein
VREREEENGGVARSEEASTPATDSASAVKLRWLSTHPFGFPVVPDV